MARVLQRCRSRRGPGIRRGISTSSTLASVSERLCVNVILQLPMVCTQVSLVSKVAALGDDGRVEKCGREQRRGGKDSVSPLPGGGGRRWSVGSRVNHPSVIEVIEPKNEKRASKALHCPVHDDVQYPKYVDCYTRTGYSMIYTQKLITLIKSSFSALVHSVLGQARRRQSWRQLARDPCLIIR